MPPPDEALRSRRGARLDARECQPFGPAELDERQPVLEPGVHEDAEPLEGGAPHEDEVEDPDLPGVVALACEPEVLLRAIGQPLADRGERARGGARACLRARDVPL